MYASTPRYGLSARQQALGRLSVDLATSRRPPCRWRGWINRTRDLYGVHGRVKALAVTSAVELQLFVMDGAPGRGERTV